LTTYFQDSFFFSNPNKSQLAPKINSTEVDDIVVIMVYSILFAINNSSIGENKFYAAIIEKDRNKNMI